MIKIVHPPITSRVGIGLEFRTEILLGRLPIPAILPRRGNIVTVEKAVGAGQPNQKTDVLLVRFMLNILAARDEEWKGRFDNKPLPHVPTFDEELGRRIRMYQQAGGFKFTLGSLNSTPGVEVLTLAGPAGRQGVGDLPPLPPPNPGPLPPLPPPNPPKPAPIPELEAMKIRFEEPLFVDSIIDACPNHRDRGTRSNLIYTIVHLNYHLLLLFKALNEMRLAPKLLKTLSQLKDPALADLAKEMEVVERTDPDRPIPRPPIPGPGPSVVV